MTNDVRQLIESQDEFGKLIADGVKNELDIASQYSFSPERLRLFKNNTRQFVQYNTITGFTDNPDVWTLEPSGGDTIHLETSESASYVVNYVQQASVAFDVNQSLKDGDKIRIGPYNGENGWLMEQRGADHSDTEVDIIEVRNNTETTLVSNATLARPITDWTRYETQYNWYNAGNQVWTQTYTLDGNQENDEFTKSSNDGNRGPESANLNVWAEVTADTNTSNLKMNVGSMAIVTLGNPTKLTRSKPQRVVVTLDATNNTWLPVYAIRLDPNKDNVNARIRLINILNYENNTDLELVAASMSPDKTDASGWSRPDYHHDINSAFQDTTNISQVPDETGTQKTLTSSDKFGGYSLASAQIISSGNTLNTAAETSAETTAKNAILDSDELVFLARTPNAGATLRFVWSADQDW